VTVQGQSVAAARGESRTGRVFLLAGEASGDVQAAHLAEALGRLLPEVELVGAGGPRMAEAGVRLVLDTSDWGVVGYVEAYVRIPVFALRFRRVLGLLRELRPDVLVLVDFPGFNVRVAKAACRSVPTVYYFPPMTYGRKGQRARVLAGLPVKVLATFPFEYEAYRAAGADVVFVGHPAADLVGPTVPRDRLWEQLGLQPGVPLLALLPGSRLQEVRSLLPVQLAAYRLLRARGLAVQAAVAVASERLGPVVREILWRCGVEVPAPVGRTHDLLAHAQAAAVASGTATLEAAVLGAPAVVVYRVSRPTEWIARRVATVPWVSLPNLLAGRPVLRELLQGDCRPEPLADALQELLSDPARAEEVRRQLRTVAQALGPPGATDRAAQEVARVLAFGGCRTHGVP